MLPVFAHDVFNLGDTGLAVPDGSRWSRLVVAPCFLAFLGDFRRKGVAVFAGTFVFSIFLGCVFTFHKPQALLISLFGMGFAVVIAIAVINTLLQQLVTDENARTCDEHVHPFIHWRNAVWKSYCWFRLSYIRVQHTLAVRV